MDWEAASVEHPVFWLVLLKECMSATLESCECPSTQSVAGCERRLPQQCKTIEQLAMRVESHG
jgi:hypothetical protein